MATTTTTATTNSVAQTVLSIASEVIVELGPSAQPLILALITKRLPATPTADQTARATKLAADVAAILPDVAALYQSTLGT